MTEDRNGFPESIFFINKVRFLQVLNENIDVLKKSYGYKATAEAFLNDLIDKKIGLQELLQNHLLIGILLGYGRHNAALFQRREDMLTARNQIFIHNGHSTAERELDLIDQKLKPIYKKNTQLLVVKPVNFVADQQSLETHKLVIKYELLHKELTELFLGEDWFYLILDKISI